MVTSAFNPPLVVPSFSSRGFPQDRKNLRKVTRQHFRSFADSFSSFLVSAFDLHFGYIRPSDIPKNSVVFVDSGGYESREWEDDSATHLKLLPHVHEKWTQALLARTIRSLPDEPRFVYVNYDLEAGLSAQVSSATAQLRHLRSAKRSFLLKEEPVLVKKERVRGQMVPIVRTLSKLPQVADSLSKFEIFGITEKSLGYSYHDRIANLHLLCCLLKKLNLNLPVHVFGALDPLSVRTYAMAGADIFDGLTWIRFAYRGNRCVYLSNDILTQSDLTENFTEGRNAVYARNYVELLKLEMELKDYRSTGNPQKLKIDPATKSKVRFAIYQAQHSEAYKKLIGSPSQLSGRP